MTSLRWQQRMQNYSLALKQLKNAVELSQRKKLSDIEKQGLIKSFEFTHELGWNLLKDYLEYQGNTSITGSRDATREAFKVALISDGDNWMEMIKSRNQTSHTYNPITANDISEKTINIYFQLFKHLEKKMESLKLK